MKNLFQCTLKAVKTHFWQNKNENTCTLQRKSTAMIKSAQNDSQLYVSCHMKKYIVDTLRFLSRCLRIDTAFLMRQYKSSGILGASPWALRMRRILLPVTWRTWATPWESRSITPETQQTTISIIIISYHRLSQCHNMIRQNSLTWTEQIWV